MSALLDRKVSEVPLPYLIVCEGYNDARFVCQLLKQSKVNNCNVGCPSVEGGHGMGKDAIANYLKGIAALQATGKAVLKGLLVVVDADEDEAVAFKEAADVMRDAGFTPPSAPYVLSGKSIKTGVYVTPGVGLKGTLEHLLWEVAVAQNPNLENCISAFAACAGNKLSGATANEQAKMKMSSLVGIMCPDNPWSSIAMLWSSKHNPIAISSPSFDHISNFIVQFAT